MILEYQSENKKKNQFLYFFLKMIKIRSFDLSVDLIGIVLSDTLRKAKCSLLGI